MRLRSALPLLILLPFAAAGQSVDGSSAQSQYLLAQPTLSLNAEDAGHVMPFWRDANGHVLSIESSSTPISDRYGQSASLAGYAADPGTLTSTGLRYGIGANLQTHAELTQQSWINSSSRVLGSEVGASYATGRYSLGVSVGTSTTPDNNRAALPRILPGMAPGVDGLSAFDSSAQFNAHGRLALGNRNGIDLSASVGRIHLLPGNLLGVSTLDQKALSFGVEHGSLSGVLIGRSMQPEAGIPGGLNTDRRWNSVDLGVTWRLPWSGSLSVGAQNLWSSGTPANTPAGPEPDQSRTPYVQYHQDL